MQDKRLLEFATEKQAKYLQAFWELGTRTAVAGHFGVNESSVRRSLAALKATAARQGYSPDHDMTHTAPEGFSVKGTSTLYGDDGQLKQQWVKTDQDKQKQFELMREAIKALSEDLPKETPRTIPAHSVEEFCSKYVISDFHIGMMAWGEETGADWDLKIAENLLVAWFRSAIEMPPNSKQCVFAQLGDFLHWDGIEAVTPTSKHILDADTRFRKLIRVAIRVMRRVIGLLLEKHQHVHVVCAEGNHDITGSMWLSELLADRYENEPRLTVDVNPDPYYCYTFGKNCFFFHHGHKKKMASVDSVFVAKFRQEYGSTEFHYADLGHLHHEKVLESNLMVLEQHRTLASPDAHASRGGWISGRQAKVTTYHKDFGKVIEHVISPKMLGVA